jgi:ubiquinone/menaquinone biosynthesis C-methylase UbiE
MRPADMSNAPMDLQKQNVQVFRGEESADRYSVYKLYPAERILVEKYYSPSESVLDLACGAGRTTVRLHELGLQVKAVDASDTLIEVAQRRFPYISFELGSYCDINEPNASFDHVLISFNGLDYAWPEQRRIDAIRECHRVLKPNGTFIFSSHNIKSFHMSPHYIKQGEINVMLRNTVTAFREQAYIDESNLHTFFASPEYVIRQTEQEGFKFLQLVGFRNSANAFLNKYVPPYIHYAFRKNA